MEHVHVGEQVLARDGPDGEGEVEGAAFDAVVDVVVAAGFKKLDVDAGPVLAEPRQDGGQQPGGDALVRAEAQLADGALDERGDVGGGGVDPGQDRSRMGKQDASGFGQAHRAGAAAAIEHARAHELLEPEDLLADGGLRVAELVGGGIERAMASDGIERHQVAELQPESISQHGFQDYNKQLR